MCDTRRSARSISVPGANNRLVCPESMQSLWHVRKHDRRGSIQQTDTAEMKKINTKRKTESDIRIFNDLLSTVWELCNPEDIGVEETNIHLGRFVQRARNPNRITNLVIEMHTSFFSRYLSDGEC